MTKKEALEQVVALGKLQQEEIAICDMYDSCNDCQIYYQEDFVQLDLRKDP